MLTYIPGKWTLTWRGNLFRSQHKKLLLLLLTQDLHLNAIKITGIWEAWLQASHNVYISLLRRPPQHLITGSLTIRESDPVYKHQPGSRLRKLLGHSQTHVIRTAATWILQTLAVLFPLPLFLGHLIVYGKHNLIGCVIFSSNPNPTRNRIHAIFCEPIVYSSKWRPSDIAMEYRISFHILQVKHVNLGIFYFTSLLLLHFLPGLMRQTSWLWLGKANPGKFREFKSVRTDNRSKSTSLPFPWIVLRVYVVLAIETQHDLYYKR